MNGSLSKEQRRNLIKAMGPVAVDAIDGCREIAEQARGAVVTVHTQQQVLARTVQELQGETQSAAKKLHERVDGVGAWCQDNEDKAAANLRANHACAEAIVQTGKRACAFESMPFLHRLRWLLFGTLPTMPAVDADAPEAMNADGSDGLSHLAYPGDGI